MSFRIVPMEPQKHRASLLALWKENILNYSEERFDWLYQQNPHGPVTTCVALHEQTGEIVGAGSLLPQRIRLNGRDRRFAIAIDFVVQKPYRVFGPALKIQRALAASAEHGPYDFILAFPNRPSQGVFSRSGYRLLGEAKNYVKVLKSEYKLAEYFKSRTIAQMLSLLGDCASSAFDKVILWTLSPGSHTEFVDRLDNRFDSIYSESDLIHPLLEEKDSIYLNWRYATCDKYRYRFFCLFDTTKTQLIAYLVYFIENNIAQIINMSKSKSATIIKRLLLEFSKELRNKHITAVTLTYLGKDLFSELFTRLLFVERPLRRSVMILLCKDCPEDLKSFIINKDSWFLLDGEMDL